MLQEAPQQLDLDSHLPFSVSPSCRLSLLYTFFIAHIVIILTCRLVIESSVVSFMYLFYLHFNLLIYLFLSVCFMFFSFRVDLKLHEGKELL